MTFPLRNTLSPVPTTDLPLSVRNRQLKVTTADCEDITGEVATIPGLSVDVVAGGSYRFRVFLPLALDETGGGQVVLGGTAVMDNLQAVACALVAAGLANEAVTDDTPIVITAADDALALIIEGGFTVADAGTFAIQFAQAVQDATLSAVLAGAYLEVVQDPN